MADRDIAVKFTGDTRDLERASDKAEKSVEGTGKSMGGALAGIAGPAAIAGAAVAGLAVVGWDLAQAAAEDEASAAQLAQQLHQAAGASDEAVAGAENYIEALSKTVAIADDELRPALATLATATGDTAKAQDLLALATDISAGSGKDLGAVTAALAKAQLGSTAGLSKLGIATEDADGKAMSLEDTLSKAKETFKGAGEAAANTSAGGLKKAGIGFDEFKEKIGSKLLPVLGSIGEFLNDKVLPAFDSLVAWAEEEWPKLIESIQPTLTDLQHTFETVLGVVMDLWNEWSDELFTIIRFIIDIYKNYLALEIKVASEIITRVIEGLKAFWAEWGDEITNTVTSIINTVKDLATKVAEFAVAVGEALTKFWDEHGDEIMEFFKSVKELAQALIDKFKNDFEPVITEVARIVGEKIAEISEKVTTALDFIKQFWADHGEEIKNGAQKIWDLISTIIGGVLNTITGIIKTATALIKGDWGGAWDAVKDTVSKGFDFIKDLFDKIGGMVSGALRGVADLITKPFKAAFNAIADLWNNTVGKLEWTVPEWIPGIGGNRVEVPDIPRFQTFGALTIVMPPGSDGYDVARQVTSFSRNVAPMGALTVAVR